MKMPCAGSGCAGTKRACVSMRHPTLDDRHVCTHTADEPRTRTAEEPAHAPPALSPLSPSCLCAFTATIKLAELRAEPLAKRWPWYN